jgi:hypothetical protein
MREQELMNREKQVMQKEQELQMLLEKMNKNN